MTYAVVSSYTGFTKTTVGGFDIYQSIVGGATPSITFSAAGDVDCELRGGGGAAGAARYTRAGGGGAGGRKTSTQTVTAILYSGTVGAGGARGYWLGGVAYAPTSGASTTMFGITALGGGYGGVRDAGASPAVFPSNGANGGGCFNVNGTNGISTDGLGYPGGKAPGNGGGGGGGMGGAGGNSASGTNPGGTGGFGVTSTLTGVSISCCGGGAGASSDSSTRAAATSGGGDGGNNTSPNGGNGVDGTGGGGGGGGDTNPAYGGNGAAGTIIIRVATPVATRIKAWTGSVWKTGLVKYWNGSAWVQKPAKRWDGSAWIII